MAEKLTIEKALQRIHWRASAQQNYKPNPNDIDAVNFMVEWVNREKTKSLHTHQLFAKIYVIYFTELLNHFKDVDEAQREIHQKLSEPIEVHTSYFRRVFNLIHTDKIIKKLGLKIDVWYNKTKEERERESDVLQENQSYFLEQLNKWTQEEINQSLENQITEAINRYDKIK